MATLVPFSTSLQLHIISSKYDQRDWSTVQWRGDHLGDRKMAWEVYVRDTWRQIQRRGNVTVERTHLEQRSTADPDRRRREEVDSFPVLVVLQVRWIRSDSWCKRICCLSSKLGSPPPVFDRQEAEGKYVTSKMIPSNWNAPISWTNASKWRFDHSKKKRKKPKIHGFKYFCFQPSSFPFV